MVTGVGVGRIVHYVDVTGFHAAAIICGVVDPKEGVVDLQVFQVGGDGSQLRRSVSYHEQPDLPLDYPIPNRCTWHFPERV